MQFKNLSSKTDIHDSKKGGRRYSVDGRLRGSQLQFALKPKKALCRGSWEHDRPPCKNGVPFSRAHMQVA